MTYMAASTQVLREDAILEHLNGQSLEAVIDRVIKMTAQRCIDTAREHPVMCQTSDDAIVATSENIASRLEELFDVGVPANVLRTVVAGDGRLTNLTLVRAGYRWSAGLPAMVDRAGETLREALCPEAAKAASLALIRTRVTGETNVVGFAPEASDAPGHTCYAEISRMDESQLFVLHLTAGFKDGAPLCAKCPITHCTSNVPTHTDSGSISTV